MPLKNYPKKWLINEFAKNNIVDWRNLNIKYNQRIELNLMNMQWKNCFKWFNMRIITISILSSVNNLDIGKAIWSWSELFILFLKIKDL